MKLGAGSKFLFLTAGFLIFISFGWAKIETSIQEGKKSRLIEFEEKITFEIPEGTKEVKLWLPMPANDPYQKTILANFDSPWPYRITEEAEFGNKLIFTQSKGQLSKEIQIKATYSIERFEQQGLNGQNLDKVPPSAIHQKPRGLVVVNAMIESISKEVTSGTTDPLEKSKAIYHYVLSRMDYDTSGSGWGNGDVLYACKVGKGNCTDFHSLFMALSIATKIPARFRIGYPLPPNVSEGVLAKPYHCWAEFYLPQKGWVPVDISEAWKHPAKVDYFFGNLDTNRIAVSTGREIKLSPPQKGEPLNYLIKPHVEVDGKRFYEFKITRAFKNRETAQALTTTDSKQN